MKIYFEKNNVGTMDACSDCSEIKLTKFWHGKLVILSSLCRIPYVFTKV